MKGYIPSNLNLGAEKHRDKYLFILTFIYYGSIKEKRNDSFSFIELNSIFLKSIIGGRYKKYLQQLINLGIIETDNQYIVKVKSKGYRLTEKYRNQKSRQVQINDERIIRNYERFKNKKRKSISLIQHQYILKCLEQIEIEYDEAKYFVESTITNVDEYVSYNCSIDLIEAKDWFFVVDKTAGRVHHNISNLSKKLRQYLRYNNQELIEVDIANSQPFLFNILIDKYLSLYSGSVSHSGSNINLSYVHHNYTEYPDIELFKKLTSEGKFYEYLMEQLSAKESRDVFKVRFFSKVFYSKENENYVYKERKEFRKLFPTVSKIVTEYKREDYTLLSIQLQKVEADIIINRIVPKLAEKKIYAITIHDSFLTTLENANEVEKIIQDEFKNVYGLVPKVRIKGGK